MNENEDAKKTATRIAREKGKTDLIISFDQLASVEEYTLEEKGHILQAITDFVLYDVKPGRQSPADVAAGFFVKNIENNNKKWLEKCEENRRRAQKRWQEQQENQ